MEGKPMKTKRVTHKRLHATWLGGLLIAVAVPVSFTVGARADVSANPDGNGAAAVAVATPPLNLPTVSAVDLPATINPDPPRSFVQKSSILWGYAAGVLGAPIVAYNINGGNVGGTVRGSCMPTPSEDGRGIAMDPLDGNLWYTFVSFPGFAGDGFIHKTTPPAPDGSCSHVSDLAVTTPTGQQDFGALDIDQGSKHIWAAGYKPVVVGSVERSYMYLIDRNTGKTLQSCWIPFRGGIAVGNDTLGYFRDNTLPGSGQYLLTDAGGVVTAPNSLAVIDTAGCHNGQQVTPVTEFAKNHGMAGVEFEWPGLINSANFAILNNGNQPFTGSTLIEFTGLTPIEDIALCGFRAAFGGSGNDFCPYPANY